MGTKPKIAIIEDDAAISGMYSAKLSASGYDVKVAGFKVDDRIIKAELTPAQVEERIKKLV